MATPTSAYAAAGVDIDEMMTGLSAIKKHVKQTATDGVLSEIGSFGGLFASPGSNHALVASTDGVGTKLKVAAMADRHHTVGQDLVNHCVNDILVQGAHPLFFMDYLGTAKLSSAVFQDVVKGLCKACRENNCALLGGETAEMPGLYPTGEYDLVGTIVGTVPRTRIITGNNIHDGDILIGLPSSGLHTNGYSLARKVLFETAGLTISSILPGTRKSVADHLLAIHKSYLHPIQSLMQKIRIRGMAHITGGGLIDNIPRILPEGLQAVIDTASWKVPALFRYLEVAGSIDPDEMYRVFNMGIGYVIIIRVQDREATLALLKSMRCGARVIGHIENGTNGVILT